MAVGDGGRPAGMEEPTTHESHNVLQRSQDSTRPAERSRERSQSCGYDSGWKGQCRAITSEWISSSSNLCDLLQCHRRILGFYHLLCFPFHTLCFSFLFCYIRFCFTTLPSILVRNNVSTTVSSYISIYVFFSTFINFRISKNILDYVIRKSFFKFVISFRIT